LKLAREETYTGWTAILGSEGNEHDAKVLCDFATNNSIKGYTIFDINPDDVSIQRVLIKCLSK